MSIHFEHSVDVARTPEQAFAVLDDFSMTPKWLKRCVHLEPLLPGPHSVGMKLRYDYRDGGRRGTMEGEIVERAPSERLKMRYSDEAMEVTVDFRIARTDSGARLTHAIDITPKAVMARLFSPIIRSQLPKQTIAAMETLRGLLEAV
ncbi:MAG TPA: SRPBCC family protein [Polyangiaceae bacterium]|nr:SRPBCC family protein [Polyangiaceae bacterium]